MCPPRHILSRALLWSLFICYLIVLLLVSYSICIKLCFLCTCIDMDSPDIVYLSSDDESPFERNQRILKEYHEEEDRRRVQSYLTRALDEVKEGKRHTLRFAARIEPSEIPIAVPLALPLEVTIAYKPGDLKFKIMSEENQTSANSPAHTIEAEDAAFGAMKFQSTITNNNQISAILRKHGLKIGSDIKVRAPASFERSCTAPRGTETLQYAAWSQEHLKTGALLPLKPYFKDYLNYVGIAPFQLNTNGYRILSALKSLYHIQEWGEPSPVEICYLLALKNTPPRKGSESTLGFYYLAAWTRETHLFEDMPNKPNNYKDEFFWTSALDCSHSSFNRSRK